MITKDYLITAAKKAVPSFKWVIGGAASFALAAIILEWGLKLASLALIVMVLFLTAIGFIVLQWISRLKPAYTSRMSTFAAWSFLIFVVTFGGLVISSSISDKPWPLRSRIAESLTGLKITGLTNTLAFANTQTASSEIKRVSTNASLYRLLARIRPSYNFKIGEIQIEGEFMWSGTTNFPSELLQRIAQFTSTNVANAWPNSDSVMRVKIGNIGYSGFGKFDATILGASPKQLPNGSVHLWLEPGKRTDTVNNENYAGVFIHQNWKVGNKWLPQETAYVQIILPGYRAALQEDGIVVVDKDGKTPDSSIEDLGKQPYVVAVQGIEENDQTFTELEHQGFVFRIKFVSETRLAEFTSLFGIATNATDLGETPNPHAKAGQIKNFDDLRVDALLELKRLP